MGLNFIITMSQIFQALEQKGKLNEHLANQCADPAVFY